MKLEGEPNSSEQHESRAEREKSATEIDQEIHLAPLRTLCRALMLGLMVAAVWLAFSAAPLLAAALNPLDIHSCAEALNQLIQNSPQEENPATLRWLIDQSGASIGADNLLLDMGDQAAAKRALRQFGMRCSAGMQFAGQSVGSFDLTDASHVMQQETELDSIPKLIGGDLHEISVPLRLGDLGMTQTTVATDKHVVYAEIWTLAEKVRDDASVRELFAAATYGVLYAALYPTSLGVNPWQGIREINGEMDLLFEADNYVFRSHGWQFQLYYNGPKIALQAACVS